MSEYCPYCLSTLKKESPERCPSCRRPRPAAAGWPEDPRLGKTVGHHRIVQRLPSPGIVVRYLASDMRSRARRWLRFIPEEACSCGEEPSERLRGLVQLKHQNVVRYRALGKARNMGFFSVLDPIPGAPLRDLLARQGRFDAQQSLWIGLQTIQGLAAAHAAGIHHGALTPETVWMTEGGQVTIAGFDLAEAVGGVHVGRRLARLMELPQYLAPEQFTRNKPETNRIDMYQVAAVVYHAWLGKPHLPDLGDDLKRGLKAMVRYHQGRMNKPGLRPGDRREGLRAYAPKLDALIGSMLSSNPSSRPLTMELVKAMWWQCSASPEPEETPPPTPAQISDGGLELPPPVDPSEDGLGVSEAEPPRSS